MGNPTPSTTRLTRQGSCPSCGGKGKKRSSSHGGVCPNHETQCKQHGGKYCYVTENGCNECKKDDQGL